MGIENRYFYSLEWIEAVIILVRLMSWTVIQIATRKIQLLRFMKLTWKMKFIFVVAFFLIGVVRFGILVLPFKHIAPMLGKKNIMNTPDVERGALTKAAKIGFVVESIGRFTPWTSKCLDRAITAQLLLRIFAIPSTLYLGMSKDESNELIAHAWLRCGKLIITGASESENFKSIMHFTSLAHKEAVRMQR